MEKFYRELADLFRHDPGGRGFARCAPVPDLAALSGSLMGCRRALIVTGFPIASVGRGETDGPPGAANLARALTMLGKDVWVATDAYSDGMTRAACGLYAPEAQVRIIGHGTARGDCAALLEEATPDHILAIERPGKHGGHYHNSKGLVVDHLVADTDIFFENPTAVTVAIGDGGNELGMGALRETTLQAVANGADIAADLGCDYALAAGVSNWWGWGIAALLSMAGGRDLLPSDAQETALLAATVAAGAVDGITALPTQTVDGLSLAENLAVLGRIRALTRAALEGRV